MTMKYTKPNDPNAARLMESLRYLGYGNYEAIADIVDNSIDADAKTISVRMAQREGMPQITIADDGCGMSQTTLDQALRLGSDTGRDEKEDLGKFGMGLVTASLSISRNTTVITRMKGGEPFTSAWDVDEITKVNKFVKHLAPATSKEVELLDAEVGKDNNGTLVILTKCDNLSNKNTTAFATVLKSHLGRVHRLFIKEGVKIVVNGEVVAPLDPLQIGNPETKEVYNRVIPVKVPDPATGQPVEVGILAHIVLVPELPTSEMDIARNMKTQGFYIMRNKREIADAETLGMFTKHNDFNRMRGEIFFPGTLDKMLGVEFTKREVKMHPDLRDQLSTVLTPLCSEIKKQEASEVKDLAGHQSGRKENSTVKRLSNKQAHVYRVKELTKLLKCDVQEDKLGQGGQVYEVEKKGKKVVLRYNVEHPLYAALVAKHLKDGQFISDADLLIAGMDQDEVEMPDAKDALNAFKTTLFHNVEALIGSEG